MLYTADNVKFPADYFQSLLKLLSMFKISIWYDESIGRKDIPEDVAIIYINCGKIIGFLLDNQTIENFITPFVANIVLRYVGLSWIIKSNQKLNFNSQIQCSCWVINGPCYNTTTCSRFYGSFFEDYVTTAKSYRYNLMCANEANKRNNNF